MRFTCYDKSLAVFAACGAFVWFTDNEVAAIAELHPDHVTEADKELVRMNKLAKKCVKVFGDRKHFGRL